MGADHYFYLITASKYMKYLRPKLIQQYGIINYREALREENRKMQSFHIMNNILKSMLPQSNPYTYKDKQGPLDKNMKYKCKKSDKLYQQIHQALSLHGKQIYSTRNHFIRMGDFLQSIDYFQQLSTKIRVSNVIQVQNFSNYIKIARKAIQKEPNEWNNLYSGIEEADQMFQEILKKLKDYKQEAYLYSDCET